MNLFSVPDWWVANNNIPIYRAGQNLDNVTSLIFSTSGDPADDGQYTLEVKKAVLVGHWISMEHLALGILLLWVVTGVIWLIQSLWQTRSYARTLGAINRVLQASVHTLEDETNTLRERAGTDALTGLGNRHAMSESIAIEAEKTSRTKPWSLIILDIDHFKRVNDTHGHPVGDEVLRQLGMIIQHSIRGTDSAFRLGGEEVLLSCPDTPLKEAVDLADRLRQTIENAKWPHDIKVTASLGVTVHEDGQRVEDAIPRADRALYRAKTAGRNQVCSE
jgi:diguanylate cyclase (GGDEF)-like protein